MALQSFTVSIGALRDVNNNDKNYVSGEAIYVKTIGGSFASIFRDLAGSSEIAQDGLANQTNEKGQFTFFVEAGDYVLEYQSQSTPVTIVGPDYFNNRVEETVNQIIIDTATSRGFRVVGDFASGFTYELPNDVAIDGSSNYWVYADINALPVTVPAGTTPSEPTYTQVTFNQASGVTTTAGINAQQFIDNFELKIFQSPTDNLTKVSTFAGGVGVVYEVRKTSDNSLATIYSDKDGVTSIPQNGTANVSNGDAECVFYIAEGDYTVNVEGNDVRFNTYLKFKYKLAAEAVSRYVQDALSDKYVSVKDFGAVGDGVNDDRPPIEAAIMYAAMNQGTVFFPATPDYYALKTVSSTDNSTFLYVPPTGFGNKIGFKGGAPQTKIQVDSDIAGAVSLMLWDGGPGGVQSIDRRIEDLSMFGGPSSAQRYVDHCLLGAEGYHPNITITACQIYTARLSCIRLATYVSTFTNVRTAHAPIGTHLEGPNPSDVITAITMNSCYGINHETNSFKFGYLTYSSLNACAADGIGGYAYEFNIARGVAMNGCGSESSDRILKINSFHGFTINGLMTLFIGNDTTPPDTLIEFGLGSSATISGIVNHLPKSYDKVFKLTDNSWGSECVVFTDSSVLPEETDFSVSNSRFDEPLKFLVYDKTNQSASYSVTNEAELVSVVNSVVQGKDVVHDVVIQLPVGDLNITTPTTLITGLTRGAGSITFQGGLNSRLVVSGSGQLNLGDAPSTLDVIFKDVSLFMDPITTGQGFTFASHNIKLVNSVIESHNGAVQYGLLSGCDMFVDSDSSIQTPAFAAGEYKMEIAHAETEKAGAYPLRAIQYKTTPVTGNVGWVRGSGAWIPF
mgnify:CR=1 FL=1